MSHHEQHGLVTKQTLTEPELAAIKQLVAICNSYEGLHMRLHDDMLRARPGLHTHDFLFYDNGTLVGYLDLDSWGIEEKEAVGMVHPDYRRQSIFTKLRTAAKAECTSRGITRLLLVCEQASNSGQAFVKASSAKHDFSEYEMLLQIFQARRTFDERLVFREANASDRDTLVSVKAVSFGSTEENIAQMVEKALQDSRRHFYLTTFGNASLGCEEPVGILRLDEMQDTIGIYGFGVLPAYRGLGYGRQMLEEAIRTIRARSQKTIMLDVDTTNTKAINLYQSCGFIVKTTYDYYVC